MLLNKEEFIAAIAPKLMGALPFQDHETCVEHCMIRAKGLAKAFEDKGFFSADKELTQYEKYLMSAAVDILGSIKAPDPETAVISSTVRAEMMAMIVYDKSLIIPTFIQGNRTPMNVQEGVKQTPNENITKHQSW